MSLDVKSEIVITCLPELGKVVATELQKYGFPVNKVSSKSVLTEGTLKDTYFLNLWLRTASHVLYKVKGFECSNPDHLYKVTNEYPWEDFIDVDSYFSVDSFVKNKHIKDTTYPNRKVKDAIVDRFMKKFNQRPNSGSDKSQIVIYLWWVEDEAMLYLDTSGGSLSKRGYRLIPGAAPLAESLAAGIILSTGWDGKTPFVNPMCGSGTLGIEAAMIAFNIPPGIYRRSFAFMHLKNYDKSVWDQLSRGVMRPASVRKTIPIYLSDINRRAVSEATKNIQKAGFQHLIQMEVKDFTRIQKPEPPGVMVMNPPYGERLEEEERLENLYVQIGDNFKNNCINYKGFVFTGNLNLAKKIGLKASSRTPFQNAKIECRLLEYEIFEGSKRTKD